MLEMLRRHYIAEGRPAAGVFASEIQAPDSYRRADLIWAPVVPSAGDGMVGHEIKVSRSDVLVELTDPMKCEAWAQFCTRWWLVVSDPAFVAGLDVPETWGIMAPPSGRRTRSMTVIRPAPARKVHDAGPGWKRVLSWQHHHLSTEVPELQRSLRYMTEDRDRYRQQAHELSYSARETPQHQRVSNIIKLLDVEMAKHQPYDGPLPWLSAHHDATDEQIVEVLLDVMRSRKVAEQVRSEADAVLRALDRVTEATAKQRERLAHLAGLAGGE
ncbi:hypothetical protein HF998_02025 [Cellulomonas hominis]|nr:hypothetical protein [Cellulomonas hominis]MBB5474699.1 hypothetical protein [Cellulomonas hominis]NKY05764.1 hypothetical protein [Cellulomonas hominis]